MVEINEVETRYISKWGGLKTGCAVELRGFWSAARSPSSDQSLWVPPRGQHWEKYCLITSLITWMKGQSASHKIYRWCKTERRGHWSRFSLDSLEYSPVRNLLNFNKGKWQKIPQVPEHAGSWSASVQLSRKWLWGTDGGQVGHMPAMYTYNNFTVESYAIQESSCSLLNFLEER